MDSFEKVASDLEERSNRLSREQNPHNLGNDEIVYSIAQFVRAVGGVSGTTTQYSRVLVWLTGALLVFALVQIIVALLD